MAGLTPPMALKLEHSGDLEGYSGAGKSSLFSSFRFVEVGVGLGKTSCRGYTYSPETGSERISKERSVDSRPLPLP